MNTDIAEGKWKQMKGALKQKWGELTDDELDQVEGRTERFYGLMQEKYGMARERAEEELKQTERQFDS